MSKYPDGSMGIVTLHLEVKNQKKILLEKYQKNSSVIKYNMSNKKG